MIVASVSDSAALDAVAMNKLLTIIQQKVCTKINMTLKKCFKTKRHPNFNGSRSFEFTFRISFPPSLQDSDRSQDWLIPLSSRCTPTQLNLNDGCGPLSNSSLTFYLRVGMHLNYLGHTFVAPSVILWWLHNCSLSSLNPVGGLNMKWFLVFSNHYQFDLLTEQTK